MSLVSRLAPLRASAAARGSGAGVVRAGYAGHSRWEPRCALIRGGDGVLAVMCPAASPGRPFHALNGTELSVRLSVASLRPRKHERSDCVRPYLSQSPRAGCLLVVRYSPPAAVAPCKFTRATQVDTSTSQVGYKWDGEDAGRMINKVVGSRRFATQAAWRMSCLPSLRRAAGGLGLGDGFFLKGPMVINHQSHGARVPEYRRQMEKLLVAVGAAAELAAS